MSTRTSSSSAAFSIETDHPWRDPDILSELYCDQELSLRETADRLGCHHETVRAWLHRHEIETRSPPTQKPYASVWQNSRGYEYAVSQLDGVRSIVGIHQLVAIADGADPHRVFSSETHIHHRLAGSTLNVPGNIEVLDAQEHLSRHATGSHDRPTPVEVLDQAEEA